jgi:hypothetical protein
LETPVFAASLPTKSMYRLKANPHLKKKKKKPRGEHPSTPV